MFPLNLYARVRFAIASCTRDRGCSAHPVFPAPSILGGRRKLQNSGASRRGEEMVCLKAERSQRIGDIVRRCHVNADQAPRSRAFDILGQIIEEYDARG